MGVLGRPVTFTQVVTQGRLFSSVASLSLRALRPPYVQRMSKVWKHETLSWEVIISLPLVRISHTADSTSWMKGGLGPSSMGSY